MKTLFKKITATVIISAIITVCFVNPVAIAVTGAYGQSLNNLFSFEEWAGNVNSAAVAPSATDGTLTTDIDSESFTLTNNTASGEVYTAHSMTSNSGYYSIAVESGESYFFEYNAGGTATSCEAFVFYFNESGEYISFENCAATQAGTNVWEFTAPENAGYIQVRFDNNTPGSYLTVSDIIICKKEITELAFDNLFVFEKWANHTLSGVINSNFTEGELTKDISAGSFTFTNNLTSGEIYTGHSMGSTSAYYSMPVKPSTEYIFEYNATGDALSFESFVFYFDSSDAYISLSCAAATQSGYNSWRFTTPENASFIQFRFDNNVAGSSYTVSDIRICEAEVYEYSKDIPARKAYTLSSSGQVYGELPAPERENLVFAGWYTEADGAGERITAETTVGASSYSLYSYWLPVILGDITLVALPDKQDYCVGERLDTDGLLVSVTYPDGTSEVLETGFACSPQILTEAGVQTITVSYGEKTAEFTVNVREYLDKTVTMNGEAITTTVVNNKYTVNKTASAFNRYEIGYSSDAYVRAVMNMGGVTEEFFLEPAEDGTFSGYIDGFLDGTTHTEITSIAFTPLNEDYMCFELNSVTTESQSIPDNMVYLTGTDYKIGVNLSWGGALSYFEDLSNDVMSSVHKYMNKVTEVDFSSKVETGWLYNTSDSVNLINCNDTGRLVQQSYYGTNQPPYEIGDYNGTPWNYNPVQGGNVKNESSKIVDLKVTDNEIYIKCRPLDWGKYSDEFAAANDLEAKYGEDYITPSYMEAWYTLEDGVMKATCRFVDFSGYPSATTTQELPAFYCVEPLNNFVYYSGGEPWSDSNTKVTNSSLQFWGDYPDQFFDCNENWAAFIGDDADSFGIGLYCPGQSNMLTGVFNRDSCTSVSPSTESPTSYIAAVDTFTFKSFNPFSYAYYITTGNADTIRSNFKALATDISDPCNVSYTNGFCDNCGKYQEPELTTDKYDLDGDDVMDGVYEISNAGELYWFREYVNAGNTTANAVLLNDITDNSGVLTGYGALASDTSSFRIWEPIGNESCKYNGYFNGQGYTVNGLYMNDSSLSYGGLFGYTASGAVIEMLGVDYSCFKGNQYTGGICGYNNGRIENCYSNYVIVSGNSYIGGITGYNNGTVKCCYNAGLIEAAANGGGIAGGTADRTGISDCWYLADKAPADTTGAAQGKTVEEFAGGEVAYLLQNANSEQIWGQKSTLSGSTPVFDRSGIYKVVAVESGGGYTLAGIGDIDENEEINVADYQQLVNNALSDGSFGYEELLRADIDCDGYLDVIDCAFMQLIINGHINKVEVYLKGDFDSDGIPFTEADVTAIKKALINQDKLNTRQKYACDLNSDYVLDAEDRKILEQQAVAVYNPIFNIE